MELAVAHSVAGTSEVYFALNCQYAVTIIAFTVTGGAIAAMRVLTDPDRLAQAIPSWAA